MGCGADLPPLPDGEARLRGVASMERARRLLAGLTDARRRMLPPRFLQSVEDQAEGADVLHQTEAPEVKGGSGGFSYLGRRSRSGAFTSPSQIEVVLTPPPQPAPRFPDEPPPLGESVLDAYDDDDDPWRMELDDLEPESFRESSVSTLDVDLDHDPQIPAALCGLGTESGLEANDELADVSGVDEPMEELSSSRLQPLSAAELAQGLPALSAASLEAVPEPDSPPPGADEALLHRLAAGEGPFGPRAGPARLILLPDESYLRHLDVFQAVLKSALGLPSEASGRLLQRCWPGLLATHADPAMLRPLEARLREAGLRPLLVANSTWSRAGAPRRILRGAGARPEPMVLFGHDGSRVGVWRHELVWAALAAIDRPDGRTHLVLDVLRNRSVRPVRIREDEFDFSVLPGAPPASPRARLRRLLTWMSPEPTRPLALDEGFAQVPMHGVGALDREAEFTEYVLLMDARERLLRRDT